MMDDLEEPIARALRGRERHRGPIADIVDGWSELDRTVDRLAATAEQVRESLRQLTSPSPAQRRLGDALETALAGPALVALRSRLAEAGTRLDAVAHRVHRDTVNIGVVGVTKSGKSTLLRTISGLAEDVVPTSAYDPTTAAASEIYHVPGAFVATVRLHDWTSFRAEYLGPLHSAANLPEPPRSEGEFAVHRYPPAATNGLLADPFLDKLRIAQESFPSYRDLLRGRREITLTRERLRPFVAYPADERDRDRPYHAVRNVRIEANFGEHAVRGLGLIDLPGSRERGLDAHRQFMRNLRNQVDLLLLVTRPADKDAFFTQADTDTLGAADEARGGVPMGDFVSVVINPDLVAGKPNFLANAEQRITEGVRRHGVRVRVSNVMDRADVLGALLPDSLGHLALQLAEMDRAAIDSALGLAREVGAELVAFVQTLSEHVRAWQQVVPDKDDALLRLAEQKRDELALDLEKLANRYDEAAAGGGLDADLVQGIDAATSQARDWVERGLGRGSKEEWLKEKEGAFAAGGARTKEAEFARARAEISAIYGAIDLSLAASVQRLWQEVASTLRGRLTAAMVPESPRSDEPLAQLRTLATTRRATRLADALDQLLQLRVEYGSVVLRVTRPIVRLIAWDERGTGPTRVAAHRSVPVVAAPPVERPSSSGTAWWQQKPPPQAPPPQQPTGPSDYVPAGTRAENVYHELTALLRERIAALETALREEASYMPNVLAAAVDIFRDATVWSERIELDYKKLCGPDVALIWPGLFAGNEARLTEQLAVLVEQAVELRRGVDSLVGVRPADSDWSGPLAFA